MKSGAAEGLLGKRVLVEISHAIERFALAADPSEPMVVISLFQKLAYFERETAVYRAIAGRAAVTVIGLAEDLPPALPGRVRHALLGPRDPLAREWSVTVLGPRGGATLVAEDVQTVDHAARTLEGGRLFRGRWSFRREDAQREVRRLRHQLALAPDAQAEIDRVLRAVVGRPEPELQEWWDAPLRFLAERVDRAVEGRARAKAALADALEDSEERDPGTGLYTEKYLKRWTAGLGGALPIGLVLLRVLGAADLRARFGMRAETAALQGVARSVQDLLAPGDRVVRLGPEEFLVVLPTWGADQVLRFSEEALSRIARLDEGYPFVALAGTAAATVTRSRPLPVEALRRRVEDGAPLPGAVDLVAG